jgi:hypothetical protein
MFDFILQPEKPKDQSSKSPTMLSLLTTRKQLFIIMMRSGPSFCPSALREGSVTSGGPLWVKLSSNIWVFLLDSFLGNLRVFLRRQIGKISLGYVVLCYVMLGYVKFCKFM